MSVTAQWRRAATRYCPVAPCSHTLLPSGTVQSHDAMAPCSSHTTQWHPAVTRRSGTVQSYDAVASSGSHTTQWHRALTRRSSTVQSHDAVAPCSHTTQWHRAVTRRSGTLQSYAAVAPCSSHTTVYSQTKGNKQNHTANERVKRYEVLLTLLNLLADELLLISLLLLLISVLLLLIALLEEGLCARAAGYTVQTKASHVYVCECILL